mmetsp:Transcript_45990/g.33749  ORF Transcript_45990/g.33749 Transcript_45990/m.33749 type:complete len:109 (+) Transcript_45990:37-363(+)
MGTFFMIIFHLLSGGVTNPAAVNGFINYAQYLSPNRYSVQLFFAILVWNTTTFNDDAPFTSQDAMEISGLATPTEAIYSFLALIAFMFFFMACGWFTIIKKNKKFISG